VSIAKAKIVKGKNKQREIGATFARAARARREEDRFYAAQSKTGEGRFIVGEVSTYDGTLHSVGEYSERWAAEKHIEGLKQYTHWGRLRVYERGVDVDVIYRVKGAQCASCLRYHPGEVHGGAGGALVPEAEADPEYPHGQCEKCGRALDSERECRGGCSQPGGAS
jgi:hypothetical protein